MTLSENQQNSVRKWAAEGASLSEIQNRLVQEFGLRMSFIEVRLLVLDLEVSIREKSKPTPPKPSPAVTEATSDNGMEPDGDEDGGTLDGELDVEEVPPVDEGEEDKPTGAVRVELSRLAQPGFALNGSVTFSDGVHAQWESPTAASFPWRPRTRATALPRRTSGNFNSNCAN